MSQNNQQTAILVASRTMGAVACLYAYSLSTPLPQIITLLRKIRCPNIIIELMYLIYRYIFILMDIYYTMELATNARFGKHTIKTNYHSLLYCAKNLLLLSFQQARASFNAMEARCYDGTLQFFSENSPISTKEMIGMFSYLIMISGGFIFLRYLQWLS